MRAVPTPILGIGSWVVWKSADTLVASDGGKIPPFRVDDVVDFLYRGSVDVPAVSHLRTHLVVGEFDSGHHDDSSVSRIPVVVCAHQRMSRNDGDLYRLLTADKRAF